MPGHRIPAAIAAAALCASLAACAEVTDTLRSVDEGVRSAIAELRSGRNADAGPPDQASRDIVEAVRAMEGDAQPRDPAHAVALLRPRAEEGNPEAQFLLGLAYASGQGVATNASTAVSWYRRAAGQGQPEAQYLLALALLRGNGAMRDEAGATRWFQEAAEAGNAGAQYHLGLAYARGMGVEQDQAMSVTWLERAAEQGDSGAQYLTGEAYQVGRGVPDNRRWATRWFARAAAQGVPDAQYMVGLAYAAGSGVPRDFTQSLFWLELAAREGVEKAETVRERIAQRVTQPEIDDARAAARAWQRVPPAATTRLDDPPTVIFVQHTLDRLGLDPGPVDGHFGPMTRRAIAAYEAANDLPVSARLTRALVGRLKNERPDAA